MILRTLEQLFLLVLIACIIYYFFNDLSLLLKTRVELPQTWKAPSLDVQDAYNNYIKNVVAVQDVSTLPKVIGATPSSGIDSSLGCTISPQKLKHGQTCSDVCGDNDGLPLYVVDSLSTRKLVVDDTVLPDGSYCIATQNAPPPCSTLGYLVYSGGTWSCLSPDRLLLAGESSNLLVWGVPPFPYVGSVGVRKKGSTSLWKPQNSADVPNINADEWETVCQGRTTEGYKLTPYGPVCLVDFCSSYPYTDNYWDEKSQTCVCTTGFVKNQEGFCEKAGDGVPVACWSEDTPTIRNTPQMPLCDAAVQGQQSVNTKTTLKWGDGRWRDNAPLTEDNLEWVRQYIAPSNPLWNV